VILNIDAANRRLSLGMKQLQPDAWETFFRAHYVGDVVKGRVSRAAPFGVFVELMPGVEGLCHRSEMPNEGGKRSGGKGKPEELAAGLDIGKEYEFKIIKLNDAQRRIGLSRRAVTEMDERHRLQNYKRQAAAATSTVGNAIKQHHSEDKNDTQTRNNQV
jgi:small subunit ribosomal protein S1